MNHKNHGNRPHVKGFRPGRVPAHVPTQPQVTYKLGLDAESKYVVIEWNKPIANLLLEPEAARQFIQNLQLTIDALLAAQAKKEITP